MSERTDKLLKQFYDTEHGFGVEEIPYGRIDSFRKSIADPAEMNPWDALRSRAMACTQCALSGTRTNVVFGEGNTDAELMFVGEAPGFDEDREGRPFVGKAGQLLTKIIEAMGFKREEVYIANCLKCRPQDNRNPLPDEIISCSPFLEEQIRLVQPKIICALGKFAAQTLLRTETPISKIRGKFFEYRDIKLLPTFHPAYLLRNPADKKMVWEDMQLILRELGRPVPKHGK